MQSIFFHNKHDKSSIPPEGAKVINVFGGDEVPKVFRLTKLPYLVDKEISLVTPGPYLVGVFTLGFACEAEDTCRFYLEIEGKVYNVYPENGLITIQIDCDIPKIIHLRLESESYYPFVIDIEVVEGAQDKGGRYAIRRRTKAINKDNKTNAGKNEEDRSRR